MGKFEKCNPDRTEENESEDEPSVSRRDFLKKSLKAAAGMILAGSVLSPEKLFGQTEQEENLEVFNLKRIPERIKHASFGNEWEFRALAEDGEYYPSFKNSLFERSEAFAGGEISGGFNEDLRVMDRFGTFSETIPDNQKSALEKYPNRIPADQKMRMVIESVSKDRFVSQALEQFFLNGGMIESGRGHYNRNPLEIEFGSGETGAESESTFYHELLHYIFDKEDSILSEACDGGADHKAITPLDERFNIVASIKRGEVPIGPEIQNLYGFTTEGKIGQRLKIILEENNLDKLGVFVNQDDFLKNYVHSGMVYPLSNNEYSAKHRDLIFKLSDKKALQIRENYDWTKDCSIKEVDFGEERGVCVFVDVSDVEQLDVQLLKDYVPEENIAALKSFLSEYQHDRNKGRDYILTDNQINDIAYLNALNAAILHGSFELAIAVSRETGVSLKQVYAREDYQAAFSRFLGRLTELKQSESSYFPVRKTAKIIADNVFSPAEKVVR
ncbi:MAG: twin-arginine translocation signal domain-containing protein [Candidatus Jorgensenbacteria bacterium]